MAKRGGRAAAGEDLPKVAINKQSLRQASRIFRFILPYRGTFIFGLICLAFSSITVLAFPFVTGKLVDVATGNGAMYTRNEIALALIGILALQALFSFLRVYTFNTVSEGAMRDIRHTLYTRIISLPMPFFDKNRVGELTSRLTSDVTQLQDVLGFTLAELCRQLLTLIIGIVVIFITSTQLTLVMLSTFPFMIVGAILFGRFIRTLSKKAQDELAQANVVVEETLQAIQAVKTFTNELYESARYGKALNKVYDNSMKAVKFRAMFISFVIIAIFGGIVLVMWYGLGLVAEKEITIGSLVSFIIYTTFIGGAAGGLGDLYGQLQKTVGASQRIVEILDEAPEALTVNPSTRLAGHVAFENVFFSYPTRVDVPVLKGLSLVIEAGQKVALVGHSGAGKSTISQLLLQLYQPDRGLVTYDNKPAKDWSLADIRTNVGIVPQDIVLFGGTIEENVAYGKPDATEAEIWQAIVQANAAEFVERFPEGIKTVVGDRGVKLSGGQRQRIAIARAMLKNPSILILDEATSSLDAESEYLVQQALDTLMVGRSTLIIAHRLSTIRKADLIYVIQDGQVADTGTHDELMLSQHGLYANLVRLQFEPNAVTA